MASDFVRGHRLCYIIFNFNFPFMMKVRDTEIKDIDIIFNYHKPHFKHESKTHNCRQLSTA